MKTLKSLMIEDDHKSVSSYLKRRGIDHHFKDGVCYLHYGPDMEKVKKEFEASREKKRMKFKTPPLKIFEERTWAVHDGEDFVSAPYTSQAAAEAQKKKLGNKPNHTVKQYHAGTKHTVKRGRAAPVKEESVTESSLKQKVKTTLRKLNPATKWDILDKATDRFEKSISTKGYSDPKKGERWKHQAQRYYNLATESTDLVDEAIDLDAWRRIDQYKKMGFRIDDDKVTQHHAEFKVTDKDGNQKHHIITKTGRKVIDMGNARPSDEDGGDEVVKKKRGRPRKDKFASR
jgi:hypothetical protein